MNTFLTTIAGGLAAASFYMIYGLGLAVVYRSTGILNFAYGITGTAAGYLAYTLLSNGLPYAAAAIVAIIAGTLLSVLIQVGLLRYLPNRSAEAAGIVTLGITIIGEGLLLFIYGGDAYALPSPLTAHTVFTIGSYQVQTGTLLDIGVAVVAALGLGLLLYRSKVGLGMRAMSEGSHTAAMFGINANYARAIAWGAAGALASVTALLVSPTFYLTPDFLTSYLISAFVVVVIGGFERIMGVVIGAIIFGTIESVFSTYITGKLFYTSSFVMILIVLMFLPYGILGRPLPRVPEAVIPRMGNVVSRHLRLLRRAGPRIRSGTTSAQELLKLRAIGASRVTYMGPVVVGGLALLLSHFVGTNFLLLSNIALMYVAVLGTDLIVGFSGQLSIGQSGFMMLGGYVAVLLEQKAGVPFLAALVASVVGGAIFGVILGVPAARLRGVYLAVLSLAFALAVPEVVSYFSGFTGGDNGLPVTLPSWLGTGDNHPEHVYYFTVVVAAGVALLVLLISRSHWGRGWQAIRDRDVAAAASGISVARNRVIAFAVGSALCSLSGALSVYVTGFISDSSFTIWTSIYLLVAIVVGGRVSTFGALLGAVFIVGVPYESASIPALSNLLLGALMIVILLVRPDGIRGFLVDALSWLLHLGSRRGRGASTSPSGIRSSEKPVAVASASLGHADVQHRSHDVFLD